MNKVVLMSGGVDSQVCAEEAQYTGELVGCVFVDYGHPAQIVEGWKAFAYCGERGIPLKAPHIRDIDLGDMASGVGARIVPHRNLMLLALAANVAKSMGGDTLIIGANAADQVDYRDCRREFFDGVSELIAMPILTPLLHFTKQQIIDSARDYGLRQSDGWSCYDAGPTPCGACPSCRQAMAAWNV